MNYANRHIYATMLEFITCTCNVKFLNTDDGIFIHLYGLHEYGNAYQRIVHVSRRSRDEDVTMHANIIIYCS